MPNWICGTFRVKGKKENIANLIENGFKPVDGCETTGIEKSPNIEFGYRKNGYDCVWLEDTKRQFVEFDSIYPFPVENKNNTDFMFCCDFRGAWRIDIGGITELAKKYGVYIRVNGYECGMQFEETYEVDDEGTEIEHTVKRYERCADWVWLCASPNMGG